MILVPKRYITDSHCKIAGKYDTYAKSMTKSWHHNGKIRNPVFEHIFLERRIRLSSHFHFNIIRLKMGISSYISNLKLKVLLLHVHIWNHIFKIWTVFLLTIYGFSVKLRQCDLSLPKPFPSEGYYSNWVCAKEFSRKVVLCVVTLLSYLMLIVWPS